MLRRLNDALPGLVAGILIWGVLLQAVGVWFVSDRLSYSVGLWYGVVIAVGMAINMASVIYDSTFEDTGGGTNYRVVIKSILRYVVVVILYALLGFFGFGNIIAAFCGTMGLKVSAYMQPLMMKLEVRLGLREPDPEYTEEMQPQEAAKCSRRMQWNCSRRMQWNCSRRNQKRCSRRNQKRCSRRNQKRCSRRNQKRCTRRRQKRYSRRKQRKCSCRKQRKCSRRKQRKCSSRKQQRCRRREQQRCVRMRKAHSSVKSR